MCAYVVCVWRVRGGGHGRKMSYFYQQKAIILPEFIVDEPALSRDLYLITFRDLFQPELFSRSAIMLLKILTSYSLAVTQWAYIFMKGLMQNHCSSCGNPKFGFIKLWIRVILGSRKEFCYKKLLSHQSLLPSQYL